MVIAQSIWTYLKYLQYKIVCLFELAPKRMAYPGNCELMLFMTGSYQHHPRIFCLVENNFHSKQEKTINEGDIFFYKHTRIYSGKI
jgi:hypothetical protein